MFNICSEFSIKFVDFLPNIIIRLSFTKIHLQIFVYETFQPNKPMFSCLYIKPENCSWSWITHYYGSTDTAKRIFGASITLLLAQQITRRMPYMKEGLLTFPEHLQLSLIFVNGVCVAHVFVHVVIIVCLISFLFVLSTCLSSYWFMIFFYIFCLSSDTFYN